MMMMTRAAWSVGFVNGDPIDVSAPSEVKSPKYLVKLAENLMTDERVFFFFFFF
jgi:hypothetical protein